MSAGSVSGFVVSFAVTVCAAPLIRLLMVRQGVLDIPNHRSSHSTPTPRGGGLACLVGLWAAATFSALAGRDIPWLHFAAATVLSLVGFADDKEGLPALSRLGAQALMGATMGVAAGAGWLVLMAAVLAPAVVNMVNFMDGINGITSLSMTVWGVAACIVGQRHSLTALTLVGATVIGCSLGFLPWNTGTARLFLGDIGSYLFGGLVTAGLMIGWAGGAPILPLLAPLAIYAADTSTALIRRGLRRESLLTAHREHVYQQLTDRCGTPHLAVASIILGLSTLLTMVWFLTSTWISVATTMVVCAAYLMSPYRLPRRAVS